MKKFLALLLIVVLMLSVVSCSKPAQEEQPADTGSTEEQPAQAEPAKEPEKEPEKARPLVVGTGDFNGDFHKGWTNSTYDKNIIQLVWGFGLLMDTPQGNVVDSPLVESKTISEDLIEWTFKIKDGIKFHNGEELSVSDIKFTYEFYMDKEALSATGGASPLNDYVESMEIDEATNTIKFILKKVIFTTDATVFYETWIFPEDTIKKGATDAGQNVHEYVKANISNPIGYGPYAFVEYKESEYVKLKVNKDYIGDVPAIEELIVRYTPAETELDQLLLGEVDLLPRQVEEEKIDPVKEDDKFTTNNYFRHGGGTIVLHTDFEAFKLTEVRQAFAYILNRPKIIELYLGKYGIASQGPYSKNQWMMYDDDEKQMIGTAAVGRFEESLVNYDIVDGDGKFDEAANIAIAQDLLDTAVEKTDGDYAKLTGDKDSGYKWDGEPLDIKVALTSFWSDTYHLAFNEDYVSKLGFKVTIVGLDWPVMYSHWTGDTEEERQYHAFVGGMGYLIKANPKVDYSGTKILDWGSPSDNGPRFTGGSSLTPEEWEQLLTDIENNHPVDGVEQYKMMFREYIKVMNKEVPIIPVYSNNYHDLYTVDLANLNTNALWTWPRAVLEANWK